MHLVPAIDVSQTSAGDIAGLDLGHIQKRCVQQAEGCRQNGHIAIGDSCGHVVGHADEHRVLKELVVLHIGNDLLAGDILHDQLGDSAHHIVFGNGQNTAVTLQEHKDHCRGEAFQFLHAIHVDEGDGFPATLFDLLGNSQSVLNALFDDGIVAGLLEGPVGLHIIDALSDLFRLQSVDGTDHLQHLVRLDLNTDLTTHGVALVLSAVQQHIAVAHSADLSRTQVLSCTASGDVGGDLLHRPFLADDVVDVLEGVAQSLECGTDSSGTSLLSGGDDTAVFLPAAQTPQDHRNVTEMIGDTDHSVGGHPTCNADNQAVQIQTSQLCVSSVSGLVSGIVDDQATVDHVGDLSLQSGQRLIVLHLQSFNGGVDLTEANITDSIVLHIVSP